MENIRELDRKGRANVGVVWSLGERKFERSWKRRIRLFDAIVRSRMMYGTEIWGWKRRDRLKRMQERYIRWCLGVDYNTPGYLIIKEIGKRTIQDSASRRAMRFQVKNARCREGTIKKECWKRWSEDRGLESAIEKERKDFLRERGWSRTEWKEVIEWLEKSWRDLDEANQECEMEERRIKLRESNYLEEQKVWMKKKNRQNT